MKRLCAWGLALAAAARAGAAAPSPSSLLSDLPDEVVAKVRAAAPKGAAATLAEVISASSGYEFRGPGLTVRTDVRWFAAPSVEGEGAPLLEVRRWPGDTVLAFYELPAGEAASAPRLAGLTLGARRGESNGWMTRDAVLSSAAGERPCVWLEKEAAGRRVGALGIPGDAGLGRPARADLTEEVVFVARRAEVTDASAGAPVPGALKPPEVLPPAGDADETSAGWQVLAGPGFTLGLPPGIRAMRLDLGVPPPRPLPFAAVWLRGRFVDRDKLDVAVGDGTHAGYVAVRDDPDEAWTAGVAPPFGAPAAEKLDEAPLDEPVTSWTHASRAKVSHWKDPGFAGDWLLFRLQFPGRGVEIGLPVLGSWRSLALFWIPVTWRAEGEPPAPPPIDPAASRGVRFDRLSGAARSQQPQVEGTLYVGTLRLDLPRGYWPVASLASRDGLPVSILDEHGKEIGRIVPYEREGGETAPSAEQGWSAAKHPGAQRAAQLWTHGEGGLVIVGKDGRGYALTPGTLDGTSKTAWMRMRDSASLTKTARRER